MPKIAVAHKALRTDPAPRDGANGGPGRVPYLDGWRGVAILTVLVGHFGAIFDERLAPLGGYGVELFFVLSGRLMADILFISRHPFGNFFRRRFARIFPALLAFVSIMAVVAICVYQTTGQVILAPWACLTSITFTINYFEAVARWNGLTLTHIWSLCVEEHSYIVLACVAAICSRRIRTAKWALAISAALALVNGLRLSRLPHMGIHEVYWRTDVRLAPIFSSAATFLWMREFDSFVKSVKHVLAFVAVSCVVLSLTLFFLAPFPIMYTASAVLLAIAVNTLEYSHGWLRLSLSGRTLTTFGYLSFSIYLWQQPFYMINTREWAGVFMLVVVGLGTASYYFIENPARRFINKL